MLGAIALEMEKWTGMPQFFMRALNILNPHKSLNPKSKVNGVNGDIHHIDFLSLLNSKPHRMKQPISGMIRELDRESTD